MPAGLRRRRSVALLIITSRSDLTKISVHENDRPAMHVFRVAQSAIIAVKLSGRR